jgi:hypothetical protein
MESGLDALCAHGATLSQSARKSYMLSAMDRSVTALERAFQLARDGTCGSVPLIKKRLKAEGYSTGQISGMALSRQLNALIKMAQEKSHA